MTPAVLKAWLIAQGCVLPPSARASPFNKDRIDFDAAERRLGWAASTLAHILRGHHPISPKLERHVRALTDLRP